MTMHSGTTRTLHTAASRGTLGSFYTAGQSSNQGTKRNSSTMGSSVRIPRNANSSVQSIIDPAPEVAFYQSPIRAIPDRTTDGLSPATSSFADAVRTAASNLQVLVEESGEERGQSDATTAVTSRASPGSIDTASTLAAAHRTQLESDAIIRGGNRHSQRSERIERYVLLNRTLAIVSSVVIFGGWSAAIYAVVVNF